MAQMNPGDITYYSAEHGIMTKIPDGYEPASHSAAKNIVMCDLESLYNIVDEETSGLDVIGLADTIVESLLEAGVTIPEDIKDPCR